MGKLNGRVTLITGVSLRSESCPKVAVYLTVIVPDPAVIGGRTARRITLRFRSSDRGFPTT